jgi:hypothetical protein
MTGLSMKNWMTVKEFDKTWMGLKLRFEKMAFQSESYRKFIVSVNNNNLKNK